MKAENESKNMFKTKSIFLLITIILGIIAVILGVTYAYWKTSFTQEGFNTVASQCFKIDFQESNDINLTNTISILNSEGEQLKPYNITFRNICDNDIKYQVNIETLADDNKLADKYITAKVNYGENKILTSYDTTDGIITDHSQAYKVLEGHLRKDQVMSVDIRLWMGEEVGLYENTESGKKDISEEIMDKTFKSKVTIEAEIENQTGEYKEEILNGTDPVLADKLIPVIIGENGTVTRADTTKKWYNYANSEWANAVILASTASDSNPKVGQEIPEDDIESYFVWIPKYSYQLWDLGLYEGLTSIDESKVHTIPIKFGTTNTDDSKPGECTTPMTEDKKQGKSGASDNCQVGEYMTHPSFISFGVNGLWVGKFETGYKDAQSKDDARKNVVATSQIIIKPNVYSWSGINASNAFENSYKYKREILDSHLMKNTEWGAVAYLSHSKYGKYTVKDGNTEIMINNSDNFVTGYSAKSAPTEGYQLYTDRAQSTPGENNDYSYNYNDLNSVVASTTGNYTGIFDMNGGNTEIMMATMKSESDSPSYSSSGFDEEKFPKEIQYYDIYKYTTEYKYNIGILGDATSEMGSFENKMYGSNGAPITSWYTDFGWIINSNAPWFIRGGSSDAGTGAGITFFTRGNGDISNAYRIVLAPKSA